MADLIDKYGVEQVAEWMNETLKEVYGHGLPQDVLDRLIKYQKLSLALKKQWEEYDGYFDVYVSGLLWNRLTPEKQVEVLGIMSNDLKGEKSDEKSV